VIATLKNLNLALRFGLELTLLAALAIYCWRTFPAGAAQVAATIGVLIVVMVIWATVVHGAGVPAPVRVAVQVLLFGVAVASAAALRRPELAAILAAATAVNAALMALWGQ